MTEGPRVFYAGDARGADALSDAGDFPVDAGPPDALADGRVSADHGCVVLGADLAPDALLDAVETARGLCEDMPVLAFSTETVAADAIERNATGYVRADGPERWTVLAARVRNALDRRRAERRGEERVRQVYERTTESFVALDTDWRITYANGAAAEFFERDPDELAGMHFFDDFPDEPTQPFESEYRTAMETQESTTFVAESHFDPGTWLEVRAYPSESGLSIYFRDVSERRRREKELETYEAIVDAAPDGIYTLDPERRFDIVNRATAEVSGLSREELIGEPIEVLAETGVADEETVAAGHRRLDSLEPGERVRFEDTVTGPDGERTLENNIAALPDGSVVNVVRDVTERRENQRALARQRDELKTLNRINGLIRTVIDGLLEETSRDGVERALCEGLVESELYRSAWVGGRDDANGGLSVRTAMGEWTVLDGPPEGPITEGPAVSTLEEGTVEVIPDFSGLPGIGGESTPPGITVPLSRGSTVDGVLVVCANRDDAFSDREREAFAVLGAVVGFALTAVRHQELLFADGVTELAFDAPDDGSAFVRASIEHDCRIEHRGLVPTSGGALTYATVSGTDPEPVLDTLRASEGFEGGRVVSADQGLLELRHHGASMILLLTEQGARVREAVSDAGDTKIVVDLPAGADVRGVVDRVQAAFPGVEPVGKRRRARSAGAKTENPETAVERLTDRQRSTLRTAFLAGYYDWPRESTAEEVADSVGISSATLHQHLRAAERKLLSGLFATDT